MASASRHDLVAGIISAAAQVHDSLDRLGGVHHHSLAAASRAASVMDAVPTQMLARAGRVARAADAVRHTTSSSLELLVSEFQAAVAQWQPLSVHTPVHGASRGPFERHGHADGVATPVMDVAGLVVVATL